MPPTTANPKPKRRWFQFSLRGLAVLLALLCVGLAWLANERNEVRKRAAAIEAIKKLGGKVGFDAKTPFRPAWLRPPLNDDTPGEIVTVLLYDTQTNHFPVVNPKDLPNPDSLWPYEKRVTDARLLNPLGLVRMHWLSFKNPQVTDASLVHLKGLTNLNKLSLFDTQVTDAGLVHLKGLTNLNMLSLTNTQVTDAGLVHLKGLRRLEQLWLINTQVTDRGVADLQKALPNVQIIR